MKNLRAIVVAVVVASLLAVAAYANNRRQLAPQSTMRRTIFQTAPQPASAAAAYKAAAALSTLTVGTSVSMTTTLSPGIGGRNILLTFVDADTDSSFATTCTGKDQFGQGIVERIPASGSFATSTALTQEGTKIFSVVTECTPQAITVGDAGIDTVAIGTGNKVGLPFQWSSDFHEIVTMALDIAANTQTVKTVNSTNLDSTYWAINAAAFSGSAIVAGDHMVIDYFTDAATPDNIFYPSR